MSLFQSSILSCTDPGLPAWAIRLWSFRPNNTPLFDVYLLSTVYSYWHASCIYTLQFKHLKTKEVFMHDIEMVEEYYKKCLYQLDEWPPEDFIDVDAKLLQRLNILKECTDGSQEYTLTQQFH